MCYGCPLLYSTLHKVSLCFTLPHGKSQKNLTMWYALKKVPLTEGVPTTNSSWAHKITTSKKKMATLQTTLFFWKKKLEFEEKCGIPKSSSQLNMCNFSKWQGCVAPHDNAKFEETNICEGKGNIWQPLLIVGTRLAHLAPHLAVLVVEECAKDGLLQRSRAWPPLIFAFPKCPPPTWRPESQHTCANPKIRSKTSQDYSHE